MRLPQGGMDRGNPSWPLLAGLISYWGIADANGSALGITLVCGNLANECSYDGLPVKILSGPSAGQCRTIEVHNGNTLTVGVAFTNPAGAVQQITAGTLFAILSLIGGGGGPGPAPPEGLSYYGVVDAAAAPSFTISGLAGLGANKFVGITNPYSAFVLRKGTGTGLAPQGEIQAITAYVTATGTFTTAAFGGGGVAVGDEILIINPSVANSIMSGIMFPTVQELVIYPVAAIAATDELADDGLAPAYYPVPAASTVAKAEATPGVAWASVINFETSGAVLISIYAEFEWQSQFLIGAGGGTQSSSKIQISRDGGTNWVDLTDNFNNPNAAMTGRTRAGVGLWIASVVAAPSQLCFRLVHWTDDAGGVATSKAQIRSNSFVRITYRST
jgi:hypothetical protein